MKENVLVIEDDLVTAKVLRKGLAYEGYQVRVANDGETGLEMAREKNPDLVVLDWLLPGMDGLEVCRRLRNGGDVLILMLTARNAVNDRVEGLDSGADDYMVKPFELKELLARVRALLRRAHQEHHPILAMADLVLDTTTRQVTRGGRTISLTAKEYDLLELFLRNPRQVLSRQVIFDRVWGYDFGGESNVLDVYVRYLREKLEKDNFPRVLHTVRGVGYILREPQSGD